MSVDRVNKTVYIIVFLLALAGAFIGTGLGLFWSTGLKPVSSIFQNAKSSG